MVPAGRPLTRGRGLKHSAASPVERVDAAPAHTRAWIETSTFGDAEKKTTKAPAHTRAWIETRNGKRNYSAGDGRPLTRGRGLKHMRRGVNSRHSRAPAHTRAWIETNLRRQRRNRSGGARSHAGVD